ncbi:hypothetical protein ACU4GD_45935 [Cupriavidus basilensis]
MANIGWCGLPLDYLDTWTRQIGKITRARSQGSFQRHVHPTPWRPSIMQAGRVRA